MSANDYILIEEVKKGFRVSHRDMDTGYALGYSNPVETLNEAVREANKLVQEYSEDGFPVEYGIQIKFLDD